MSVALRAGDIVGDKYRIERQLGSGGMGVVLEATHLQLNQPVALKFLVESGLEHGIATERFLREARATFRLRSEHTVRVMDVGTLPTGEPFMVMEKLDGKDFKQLLADRGPLPVGEASLYMMQVCNALQEAHALGIIHRDLKARNLYVTTRVDGTPCVKVLDFGISKMKQDQDAAPLTVPDMGMGSPRYMAPEQWTNASTVDARADIYAAGAVFYELLTGQYPLAGLQLAEVIKRIRAGAVPSPKDIRPDLSDAICRVVMRALRPRPEERFPTAQHFAEAIREAQQPEAAKKPKPMMSMTVPTTVMNREVMLARAQVDAHFAGTSSAVPSTDPDTQALSSTLDEGGPAVKAPAENEFNDDVATIVTRSPVEESGPYSEPPNHATLQVAEVPPEIQALRNKMFPGSAPAPAPLINQSMQHQPRTLDMSPQPAPQKHPFDLSYGDLGRDVPVPPLPPAPLMHMSSSPPQSMPQSMPHSFIPSAPMPELAQKGVPPWLFWTFLVISFCFAGGVAAALLTRYLP
jgi:serine/threonine protein kinase